MTERGRIIEVEGQDALVAFARNEACAGCNACRMGMHNEMRVSIKNTLGAKSGDSVEVELEAKRLLSAGAWAYLFPMVMVFFGLGLGYVVGPAIGANSDIAAVLSSMLMLGVSFIILKIMNMRFTSMAGYSPVMRAVYPVEKQGVDDDGFAEPNGV